MTARLGFLFPGQTKTPNRPHGNAIRVVTSSMTLSRHERSMVNGWEASMWLERREIAAEPAPRSQGPWTRFVAAVRRFVFRMQLGPVGED